MSRTSSETRSLRSSCDKCHQAKLKCVPGLTGCQRCANLDLHCVYSPPGRSGRVPVAERLAKRDGALLDNSLKRQREAITPPRSQSPSVSEMVPISMPPRSISSSDDTNTERGQKWQGCATPSSTVQTDIDPMINGIDFISGADSNMSLASFDAGSMMELSIPAMASPMAMLTPTTMAVIDFTMATEPIKISEKAPEPVFNGRVSTMNTKEPTSQCGCFQSIIKALQDIQNPAVRSFSLDATLSRNKAALIAICDTLKCASSHDGTTRLVALVVLQRALYLYRNLYQSMSRLHERHHNMYDDPDSPYIDTASSSSLWSSSSSCYPSLLTSQNKDTCSFSFIPHDNTNTNVSSAAEASKGRLSLGTYKLDYADEDSLTKQLLILDLNKIPRLLERLDRRAYGPDGLDEPDGLDLYNILRSAFMVDFTSLVREAAANR